MPDRTQIVTGMPPRECICQICTCGRHHCPHKPRCVPTGPCVISEYNNRYRQFPIDLRESFKPKGELRGSDAPLEDKTNHRIDYIPHKLEKPYMRDPGVYKKPEQAMDMQTCYNQNYTGKVAPPPKAIRNEGQRKVSTKFDGEPTYRADYRKWAMDPRKSYGPDQTWIPPDTKFGGLTTQRNDFPGYVEAVRESMKPQHKYVGTGEPMNDMTDYRHSYIKHAMPQRFMRDPECYKGPAVPLDSLTTFRRDYLGKQAPRMMSCKPDAKNVGSGAPLENMTTVRADYREWPTLKPYQHKFPPYKKPDGEIEGATTYSNTFRPNKGDRAMTCKPVPAHRAGGQFDGTTNYMTEYKKWDGVRAPKALMKPELVLSELPFEGISTQRAHFTGYPYAGRVQSCRPLNRGLGSDAPFDDSTIYRTEYTQKEQPPCPIPTINLPTSRYLYHGDDEKGHKFYDRKNGVIINVAELNMAKSLPRELTVA